MTRVKNIFTLKFDPYVLVCVALGLLLCQPLLATGMPNTADGLLHLYRSALWRWAWDEGVFWPRWHTILYMGYGYPLFNFYAPLLYIATSALSLLVPTFLDAFKAILVLIGIGYACGMYLWAKDILGRNAALVAATAYALATFRFRELYVQGNYAQFLAWSFYPWILFFFRRLTSEPTPGRFIGATVTLSALLLAHNISALLFAPLFGAYVLGCMIVHRHTRGWLYAGLAGLCALGIGAVFWLPALAEASLTRVDVLTRGFFDVQEHFLSLRELFAASPRLDYRATNPPMPFNFGRLHLILAFIGGWRLLRAADARERHHLIFALAGSLASCLMMLPISLPIWQGVPLIAYVEFPSRVYGVAFLCSSLLIGAAVRWTERRSKLTPAVTGVALFGLIVSVAVYMFPRPFPRPEITLDGFRCYEQVSHVPGTTSAGEYLSQWTNVAPAEPALSLDGVRTVLIGAPADVQAEVMHAGAQSLRLHVQTPITTRLALAQFYFPGWQAWVDGAPVVVEPCEDAGLICLDVPGGAHDIQLRFADTPIRRFARGLSGAFLALTALVAWRIAARRVLRPAILSCPQPWPQGVALAALVVGVMVFKVAWVEPHTMWFRLASPPGVALPAQFQAELPVGERVKLLGYDLERPLVKQGEELHIRLYWQTIERLDASYAAFTHLVAGPQRQAFAGADSMHPGYIPTMSWNPALYVVDDHLIRIPADAPPVAFKIDVGLYERSSGERIGQVTLPTMVHVLQQPALRLTDIPNRLSAHLGASILLLGHHVISAGQTMTTTLYWQTAAALNTDYQVFVHVLDEEGRMIAQGDGPPMEGLYPSSTWLPDQIIADPHIVELPAETQPDALRVGLYDPVTGERLPAFRDDGTPWPDNAIEIELSRP